MTLAIHLTSVKIASEKKPMSEQPPKQLFAAVFLYGPACAGPYFVLDASDSIMFSRNDCAYRNDRTTATFEEFTGIREKAWLYAIRAAAFYNTFDAGLWDGSVPWPAVDL